MEFDYNQPSITGFMMIMNDFPFVAPQKQNPMIRETRAIRANAVRIMHIKGTADRANYQNPGTRNHPPISEN